jgi:proteasome lid subunit RPN8/RPN11
MIQTTGMRKGVGVQAEINLDSPAEVSGAVVVGIFHTHPNPTSEGWDSGPSEADRRADERDGVPDLIRADDGIHLSGPESRRGGLGGGPGYPP